MTLKPADMENCNPKRRCTSGVNEGAAYTPGDECPSGYYFDDVSCNCIPLCYPGGSYRVDWEFNFRYTARKTCSSSPFCSINCDLDDRIDCGPDSLSGSFSYGGGGCLIPVFLQDAFDACGQPISSALIIFYNCSEPVADPTAPNAPCGVYYSSSRSGCAPGAIAGSGSVDFDVVDLNA